MKAAERKLTIFTDKFPLLGPIIWLLSAQYFAAQIIVASSWPRGYSWANNLISDLGNTACEQYGDKFVCSPYHVLMNGSFILLGLIMALGSLLIYQEFKKSRGTLLGFGLMALAGLGTILVGAFPENTIGALHGIGATLGLVVGNISLVVLAFTLKRVHKSLRIYTFITGIFTLSAFALFYFAINFGLGQGTIERLVSYPQTLWLILFGIYMTASHVRNKG